MSRVATRDRTVLQHGEYEIRQYQPGDFESFCDLYEDVWGWRPSRERFEWRYGSPYVDHIPMVVAANDRQLVGALPTIAYRLRSAAGSELALQPADAMVHPDHRRKGLLTGISEFAIERYREGQPTCFFNFPNAKILGAFLDLGWEAVGPVRTYYRIQNPSALDESVVDDGMTARLADATARGFLRYLDARADETERISVEHYTSVPEELLADLYRRSVPERIHAERDRPYYRWRFANPNWDCHAYVASRDGPTAALIACRLERRGTTYLRLMETAPLSSLDLDCGAALLDAVISDHADADVFAAAEGTLQHDVLAERGFRRDDQLPLSLAATERQLVVRPLDPDTPTCQQTTDRSNWLATFGEQDGIY